MPKKKKKVQEKRNAKEFLKTLNILSESISEKNANLIIYRIFFLANIFAFIQGNKNTI